MASKEDIEVTQVDQQRINSFATWNFKFREYTNEYDEKKKELANLNDAEDELLLSDVMSHPYMIGESFFHLSTEDVNERLQEAKENNASRMAELDDLILDSKAKMHNLKKDLYAKFGNHINLEEN